MREKGFFFAAEMRKRKNGRPFERNQPGDNEHGCRNDCDKQSLERENRWKWDEERTRSVPVPLARKTEMRKELIRFPCRSFAKRRQFPPNMLHVCVLRVCMSRTVRFPWHKVAIKYDSTTFARVYHALKSTIFYRFPSPPPFLFLRKEREEK